MEGTLDSFSDFAGLAAGIWETEVLGLEIGTVVAAVLVFVACLGLRGVFTRVVVRRLARWAGKTKSKLDDEAVAALEPPLRFTPLVVGLFLAKAILPFAGLAERVADDLLRSLAVFVVFWALYRLAEPLRGLATRVEEKIGAEVVDWTIRGLKIAFVAIGAITVLEIWGIEVAPILAGLGLIGVAVALGAQDLFRNLIAGLLIIGERRLAHGEWIKIDGGVEGTVEAIGFRSTRVRQFDKAPIYVPNSRLSDTAVVNYTRMTHRRIYWMIGVEYRTTVDQLRRIRDGIETFLLEDDDFAHPPEVPTFVRIDRFSDSSIDIMVYCFTVTTVWGEWLAIKERLAYRIKAIVEEAGSDFAFPSRTLYVEPGGDGPEIFIPPEPGETRDQSLSVSD